MQIVVDAYGGDNAPSEIIKGAVDAVIEKSGFDLVLVGKEEEINSLLSSHDYDKSRISVINASTVITNDDSPSEAIRRNTDSSLVKALEYLRNNGEAKAFVSAGSTGAVLTGAVLLLKRIKGINRPALSPLLPTINGKQVLLIDCGANVEPKANNILQFGLIGSAFMQSECGVANPRVALLSNGVEDKKGTTLNKEAFALLKDSNLNFVGNMEARDLLSGEFDVIVSDGFSGNIALKSCEGTALGMFSLIKQGILKGGLRAKLGYLLLKPVFKEIKNIMDYNNKGGAVLLGLNKIVVKSHGSSKAKAIKNSILQAKNMVDNAVIENIADKIMV